MKSKKKQSDLFTPPFLGVSRFIPDNEPDFVMWKRGTENNTWSEKSSHLFVIDRRPICMTFCGYLIFPYEGEFPETDKYKITCHGGITYSQNHYPTILLKDQSIELLLNTEKIWVLGFDCAHGGDIPLFPNDTSFKYKDLNFCFDELLKMEKQLIELKYLKLNKNIQNNVDHENE